MRTNSRAAPGARGGLSAPPKVLLQLPLGLGAALGRDFCKVKLPGSICESESETPQVISVHPLSPGRVRGLGSAGAAPEGLVDVFIERTP